MMLISIVVLKFKLSKSIEFDDVIILKTMKTWNCQFLGTKIAQEDTEKMR